MSDADECGCGNTECGRCFPWANAPERGAVEKAIAHFHEVSDELMSERCKTLEVALWQLANECDGMRAFERDIRAVVGHSNWSVLRQRVDGARDLLKAVPEDVLRTLALNKD
jgi:hypothetical protein